MQNNSQRMATEKIGKLLFRLSLPAMTAMIIMALYNIVDTIFVGQGVGVDAIGGIAVVLPLQMAILAIGLTFGVGGASIISRALGANDKKSAAIALGNTTCVSLATGLLIMLLGLIFKEPLLKLFGAHTKALLKLAGEYFDIMILGTPLISFAITTNSAARAEGRAKVAMTTMLIGAILNMILDPIFIFVFKMGVSGAALATVIGQSASAIFLFTYFQSGKSEIHFHISYFKPDKKILKETVAVGASSFSRQISSTIMIAVLNNTLVLYGGEDAVSIFAIIFRLTSFVLMPTFGIAQGMQPIMGYNYGADKIDRVKKCFSLSCVAATIITALGGLIFVLFPDVMLKIFISSNGPTNGLGITQAGIMTLIDPHYFYNTLTLFSMGEKAIRITTMLYPLVGFQVIGATMFMALGKAMPAFLLSIARQILFLIPTTIILPKFIGLDGVWLAFPISETLAAAVTLLLLVPTFNKLQHKPKKLI